MAASGIPLDAGTLMSTVLEGILYGFSILLFMATIWSLTYKQRIQDINRPIATVVVLLWMLSTAHIIVNIIRVEDAFVKYRYTYPGGPSAFLADVSQQTYVLKHALYVLQTLLADGVVIYRCYIVWQSIWIIIVPSMLWCSVAVTGIIGLYCASQSGSDSGDIYAQVLAKWVTAFFSLTIATNLLSSGLLIYRIWLIERNASTVRVTNGTMMPLLHVLMDTAVLYSVVLFTALICFVCSSNGEVVMLDMIMPIVSIAFYIVLIRIAISRKTRSSSNINIPRRTTSEAGQDSLSSQQHSMQPLQVHIPKFNVDTPGFGKGNEGQISPYPAESV
ncbi:uncharacterized protein F5891DRAFT_957852 [Suillus fuscotomentosus]|uniref:Uncharacterized protein n=1 Tax=Suillus fuscotomentosus TaxID=1912939 RepID=A0AAD4E2B0_9AGAM|nr:uncharacterized protein F5891DRAFT_957852 [Suillus fuscotomentosus]KAG1896988.1 hypothetical protein F5891DRAFT_957852 [Suillus fuscotomentosus]